MSCSCILIGTTLKNRRKRLFEAVRSVHQMSGGLLSYRLTSIDNFGEGLGPEDIDVFKENKFDHMLKKRRGMVASLREALDKIDTEWLLYCEDDIKFRFLPSREEFDRIKLIKNGDRECGIMGLCCGGYEDKYISGQLNDKNNYVAITNKLYAFKRFEQYRNRYFIDFPATFIKTELLKACIDKAVGDNSSMGIEKGITKAWFDLKFDEKFHKVSLLQNPWMDDKDSKVSIYKYTNHLMPIILNGKDRIFGGHKFGH